MEQLADYPFVQAYMAASVAAFVWFGLAIPLGPRIGSVAGARVLRGGLVAYVIALAAVTAWALLDGQWARFVVSVGLGVLFEMAVFVALWLFIVYFMASRNLSDRRRAEMGERSDGLVTDPMEHRHA